MELEDKIFENHYNYYKNIGVETIKQQAGQVEQVSADYQGRVIYELLQNAFDKAKENIRVEVIGDSLYIANDGSKFSYNANHDYLKGSGLNEIFRRYDFQSLCSISTSTKSFAKSIGNKGVGFKSVFSIAKDGFVNVYTQGVIVENGEEKMEKISFGVYDSFKEIEDVSDEFNLELKECIVEQISLVQQERKDRGVPGYYFPFHIKEEPRIVLDYFDKGFVTVIEIPFESIQQIKPLFDEIRDIHFNFISLKYSHPFKMIFNINGDTFEKSININRDRFFTTTIKNESIESLAKEAGIAMGMSNKIGLQFKAAEEIEKGSEGLMYNYLPTRQASPFKNIDFHADFHTSVDRKTITFDQNSKVGRYNAALLKGCVELLFCIMNNSLPAEERVELNINNIERSAVKLKDFNWYYLDVRGNVNIYNIVRAILRVEDTNINQWNHNDGKRYYYASNLFANIASSYFLKDERTGRERRVFFNMTLAFTHSFTNDYKMQYSRSEIFKRELADAFLAKEVQLLPNVIFNKSTEVLYKDSEDKSVSLPPFLGISITNFKILDDYFSKCLGIKKYSDINVLFKYFRQVSIKGEVSKERFEEQEQITLLKSLYELFKTKKERITSFVHRYASFLSEYDRKNLSAQNITSFSVSTVFLKTVSGKYKPAQLCNYKEIDEKFVNEIVDKKKNINSFLLFLGVSPVSNYLVVDDRIYKVFKDGIDYIPALYSRDETGNLTAKAIIPNIKIIASKKSVHPALVNYNRYHFLEDISNTTLRKQLTPLRIGSYESFPDEYADVLLKRLKKSTKKYSQDVFRFYSTNVFGLLKKRNEYLSVNNGKYSWTDKTNFKIASNRNDFGLLKSQSIDLLCFFNGKEVPFDLQQNVIDLKVIGVEIDKESDITIDFKASLDKIIPYVLIEISYLSTNLSEKEYLNNIDEVSVFQRKWQAMIVKTGDDLAIKIEYQEEAEPLMLKQKYCFHQEQNTLYFDEFISNNEKASAIARHVFNVRSLSAKIELMCFHKKVEELHKEYDQSDINLITSKWMPDYEEKFSSFQKHILSSFGMGEEIIPFWFVYNEGHRSEVLIRLDKEKKLNELIQVVNDYKLMEEYENYFESFTIEIDLAHIEKKVSELLLFLESKEENSIFVQELEELSNSLNIEVRLVELELEILNKYPSNKPKYSTPEVLEKQKELALKNRVQLILDKLPSLNQKDVHDVDLNGSFGAKQMPIKSKKIIFKGTESSDSQVLETMGASGEEEVLLYFINEFILIKNITERIEAINEVYILLKEKIGDDSHQVYKDKCLEVIKDDLELRKALILFFYVTMHYKFSYFDLIVYYENKATLVEVKTTTKSKRFYISRAEIEAARGEDNYLIVRNTTESINFLGNPIKEIEGNISFIQGDKFSLKPINYEFLLND